MFFWNLSVPELREDARKIPRVHERLREERYVSAGDRR